VLALFSKLKSKISKKPMQCRQQGPQKHQLTSTRLYCIISQNTEHFLTTKTISNYMSHCFIFVDLRAAICIGILRIDIFHTVAHVQALKICDSRRYLPHGVICDLYIKCRIYLITLKKCISTFNYMLQ
jgi:hypothetical protein